MIAPGGDSAKCASALKAYCEVVEIILDFYMNNCLDLYMKIYTINEHLSIENGGFFVMPQSRGEFERTGRPSGIE
jgi:hypothetical protein